MDNVFILTLLVSVVILTFFIAPLLISISVYRHAVTNKIKNPLQWALISGLVPLYMGLVIYMIKFESMEKTD